MLLFYLLMLGNEEDKDKFTELYEIYRSSMFYVANGILRDESLAEDAVHEAFIRIIKNFHKIDMNDCHKTKGFVVTIVKNVSFSMIKQRSRETVEEDPLMGSDLFHKSAEREVEANNTVRLLLELLKEMKPESREALMLAYYHGMKSVEMAKVLGISAVSARKRLQRSKEEFKAILKKKGIKYDEI